jgi:hypothetical protein
LFKASRAGGVDAQDLDKSTATRISASGL